MKFNEPKVEFVSLDPGTAFDTTASCTDSVSCEQYGVETCLGVSPMNSCDDESDWL